MPAVAQGYLYISRHTQDRTRTSLLMADWRAHRFFVIAVTTHVGWDEKEYM